MNTVWQYAPWRILIFECVIIGILVKEHNESRGNYINEWTNKLRQCCDICGWNRMHGMNEDLLHCLRRETFGEKFTDVFSASNLIPYLVRWNLQSADFSTRWSVRNNLFTNRPLLNPSITLAMNWVLTISLLQNLYTHYIEITILVPVRTQT